MQSRRGGLGGLADMLFDDEWTPWHPIYAWLIEHQEGLIAVDTGETARVHERGYHPRWHPFPQRAVRFSVHPDEEFGPQLRALGFDPRDVRQVVLTHLHTDHAGGLYHLTGATIWVDPGELKRAGGFGGLVQGYLPHRWPKWWDPKPMHFNAPGLGPFDRAMSLTRSDDVLIVPTPGHTPHHVSVVVLGEPSIFLAGDTSWTQGILLAGQVDGVGRDPRITRQTYGKILGFARERPLVYLPSHDPDSAQRLAANKLLKPQTIVREEAVIIG